LGSVGLGADCGLATGDLRPDDPSAEHRLFPLRHRAAANGDRRATTQSGMRGRGETRRCSAASSRGKGSLAPPRPVVKAFCEALNVGYIRRFTRTAARHSGQRKLLRDDNIQDPGGQVWHLNCHHRRATKTAPTPAMKPGMQTKPWRPQPEEYGHERVAIIAPGLWICALPGGRDRSVPRPETAAPARRFDRIAVIVSLQTGSVHARCPVRKRRRRQSGKRFVG
jgi:hypothetical protein